MQYERINDTNERISDVTSDNMIGNVISDVK